MKENIVISNAFSLNMIPSGTNLHTFWIKEISLDEVKGRIAAADSYSSIIGHGDTAVIFSNTLGVKVDYNRTSYSLDIEGFAKAVSGKSSDEDTRNILVVGQYIGPRLPEGVTTLPEGANIKWFIVDYYYEY